MADTVGDIPLSALTFSQLVDLLAPLIDRAAREAVSETIERMRIARYMGGTVTAVGTTGDTVICVPDDNADTFIEASRFGGTAQVAGVRVLLVFTDQGATYALGVMA